MTPSKFYGATSREVLRKVKQALGEDALILTNRPVAGGMEITALPANAMSDAGGIRSAMAAHAAVPMRPTVNARPALNARPAAAATVASTDGTVPQLMRELSGMKALLQRELSGIAWTGMKQRAPARAAIMQVLLDAGFSASLSRELITVIGEQEEIAQARKTVSAEIERRLPMMTHEALVEQGGVFALVGPTGVGKTTTVAKLAARCVVRHGAHSLALLTTDSYRIAAHDQLRVYGKILGVPVHAIKDAHDLKVTLTELRDKRTVLIDTIGMSQRDQMVAEQSAMLTGGGPVKRLLLLNATANAATLDEVIGAYAKGGVHGCIVTKVDESASLATALDSAIRHKLVLHYVTNGQRVPEDVHLPNRNYLMHRALRPVADLGAHGLRPEEYPLAMAGATGAMYG
jgi:flagellar biosynthesis protein FlhF